MTWKEKGKRAGTIHWWHALHHRRCHAQNATRSTQDLTEDNPPETTVEGQNDE
ncbi:hypothetical protein CQR47_0912 [Bifidobacterium thermophilum]|uniref:Uncharacterized protein n=1 Tax=Bifidobacterium thermophilum TaxID=33905 RepID=A0A2N3QKV8_9BIFI|nr:hypothetical protein [Bifidobacterium thermophilum]PKU92316.1 hypothetical protein CQR47_0912 [Bifidobacterium thermophilum]